ncbi:CDK-activating kinase assembly factor [Setomelanomma holmii]|uniref:RNA polymerase II transcription factor B subunit 3 n=1 Tax=Setomelanomma holmii TaxID=210430 RepID=A0A9P4H9R6_9PLEO|nr:CDK-activating kinase assembly factor [Setomelanomma holmii]
MSKQLNRANGASTKRLAEDGGASPLSKSLYKLSLQPATQRDSPADSSSDICPVCKSSRYLNPNMQFKINPECYHKMCESCVDRIFSHGPAPCPIAGCARTLRKGKFRKQKFEDLKVEREVDIRKRVASAMNKQEDDFETLRDYNDYLEQVEEITWNLILKIDVEATEARLRRWEEHQKADLPNATRREFEPSVPTDHVVLKKGATQRKIASFANTPQTAAAEVSEDTGFSFHGLKKRVAPPREAPFDAFGGWSIAPQYYYLQEDYGVDWFNIQKNKPELRVGGYNVREYCDLALRDAFGGFGVFIEDEKVAEEIPSLDANVATGQAAAGASGIRDVNMDDVF